MKKDFQKQLLDNFLAGKIKPEINSSDNLVTFSKKPQYLSIGIVDIVNSTNITANLSLKDSGFYYSIFLNSMADIVRKSGGIVIKNIGDSLMFSFQKNPNLTDSRKLNKMLECGLNMIDAHNAINERLLYFDLPEISYRVSADYGPMLVAHTKISPIKDLFGIPVNSCSKINHKALPNTMLIGEALHKQIKSFRGFNFKKIDSYILLANKRYSIYKINRSR